MTSANLTLLQLADSGFPTGGFAHSNGLEAAWQSGEVEDLQAWIRQSVWQSGYSGLPFVGASFDAPGRLRELDGKCDVFLNNPVAKRASKLQGQAFLAACAAAFGDRRLVMAARKPVHQAPAMGFASAVVALSRDEALGLYLYTSLRGTLSAAVRLGACGPLEAQRLLGACGPLVREVGRRCARLNEEEAALTAPLHDLIQSAQDRLYSRLFQS